MGSRDDALCAPRPEIATQGTAVVTAAGTADGRCTLSLDGHAFEAARAAACLIQPELGDTVFYVRDDATAYVTAVLKRASGAAPVLSLPAATVIAGMGGRLEIRADELALRARSISVDGEQALMNVEQVVGVGRKATWSYGAVKLTAELVELLAERLLQFSRWSQRMVDGPDQVRSRQIDYRAEQTLQLQAPVVIANADKLLKADGEQIHLG